MGSGAPELRHLPAFTRLLLSDRSYGADDAASTVMLALYQRRNAIHYLHIGIRLNHALKPMSAQVLREANCRVQTDPNHEQRTGTGGRLSSEVDQTYVEVGSEHDPGAGIRLNFPGARHFGGNPRQPVSAACRSPGWIRFAFARSTITQTAGKTGRSRMERRSKRRSGIVEANESHGLASPSSAKRNPNSESLLWTRSRWATRFSLARASCFTRGERHQPPPFQVFATAANAVAAPGQDSSRPRVDAPQTAGS